jgi:hypothetical protein
MPFLVILSYFPKVIMDYFRLFYPRLCHLKVLCVILLSRLLYFILGYFKLLYLRIKYPLTTQNIMTLNNVRYSLGLIK